MSFHKSDKRRLLFPVLGLIALLGSMILTWQAPAAALTPHHYTELDFPPLPTIQIPNYERFQLDNGLVVYLMEDHELPLVSGSATFRTGSRFEPADKVGLANLTGDAMRLGGTTTFSPDAINQMLEQRAAAVETSIDLTSGQASFNALAEDLEDVLALFADVIQKPAFDPQKIDLLKKQYGGSIARRNDEPDEILSREFQKLVYGANSPYARTIEYATLNNISRTDIINFYRASIRPEQTILGIVGDFDAPAIKQLIAAHFADWQGTGTPLAVDQVPTPQQAESGLFMVEQPQLSQSYINIGHLGGMLDAPDNAALSVMNEVLNGFSGRLFNEIRSRQGLAYVVYAFWAPRYDYPGLFIGGGQTRSDATVPFIQAVTAEIERIRTTPISSTELKRAQDSVLNSFVFKFQSPDQTLSRLVTYEYYGYPEDFVFQFQKGVQTTSIEDVLTAARTHLAPDDLVVLVVGNSAEIKPDLTALSPGSAVTQIDVTIPEQTS